jgi:hypothetical protein
MQATDGREEDATGLAQTVGSWGFHWSDATDGGGKEGASACPRPDVGHLAGLRRRSPRIV